MRPFLTLARTVTRAPSTCAHCQWALVEFDARYSIRVGDTDLIEFCSQRCAEADARLRLRGALTVGYRAVAA